jgi:hypothetical protein
VVKLSAEGNEALGLLSSSCLLFCIFSAKKFLLLDLSDCEFGPLSSMAEYLTPND